MNQDISKLYIFIGFFEAAVLGMTIINGIDIIIRVIGISIAGFVGFWTYRKLKGDIKINEMKENELIERQKQRNGGDITE